MFKQMLVDLSDEQQEFLVGGEDKEKAKAKSKPKAATTSKIEIEPMIIIPIIFGPIELPSIETELEAESEAEGTSS